jgi:hypothetical protein
MKIYRKEEVPTPTFFGQHFSDLVLIAMPLDEITKGHYNYKENIWIAITYYGYHEEITEDFVWCYPPKELVYTPKK